MAKPVRVMIVDDSAIVRRMLQDCLREEADIQVVATAPDPFVAREKILRLELDVITLDIEMPRMDGLSFLKRIMRYHPLPVIIISSLGQSSSRIAIEAMRLGAVDVLAKPGGPYSVGDLRESLAHTIRAASTAKVRLVPAAPPVRLDALAAHSDGAEHPLQVFAMGSSTGGTQALEAVLTRLPACFPPVLVAQHIPPVFSASFARRLDELCAMRVQEAANGMVPQNGNVYVAPGDFHMLLRGNIAYPRLEIKQGPKVCYQRPSVDVLFESVAKVAGPNAAGVILTGMGSDGAQGLLSMRSGGAHTIAQDEHTCVVFGMPREAIARGAASEVLPLHQIALAMCRATGRSEVTCS